MNILPIYALVAMAREANRSAVYYRRRNNTPLALAAVGRRAAYMAQARVTKDDSLARVNGWGSAGECPASADSAKTPATRERVSCVAGVRNHARASVCGGEVV